MMYFLLAIAPIILLVILLLVLRRPLIVSAPITFGYVLLLSITHWSVKVEYLGASFLKALLVSLDIALIIFGAILFLEYLKSTGLIKKIEEKILRVSSDKKIQVILIVWFFGSFIEGVAGFGTPAAITAPLLVAIGFPAILAVVLALIGNSTAVIFGAVGTPVNIGFTGLDVALVPQTAAFINLFAGLTVPLLLVWTINSYDKKPFRDTLRYVPFALWAGLCFLVPYFLFSFLGSEFPSILGSIIGLVLVVFSIKKNFFVPFKQKFNGLSNFKGLFGDLLPYFLLVFLLVVGKYFFPSRTLVLEDGVTHTLSLNNPGFVFLLTILFLVLFKQRFVNFFASIKKVGGSLVNAFVVILFITGIVQLLILSSFNHREIPGMLQHISGVLIIDNYLFISPVLGAFGSFLAGSATVSNLLFGAFQVEVAGVLGISTFLVLALQLVGAGIGNMLSLTNIVAAQATVKLKNQELKILRGVFLPAMIYLLVVILLGVLLSSFL